MAAQLSPNCATIAAMMARQMAKESDPRNNVGFRPQLSTKSTAGMVKTKLTTPTIPVARMPDVEAARPIDLKMVGA